MLVVAVAVALLLAARAVLAVAVPEEVAHLIPLAQLERPILAVAAVVVGL